MTTLTPLAEARAKSNPNGCGSQGSMRSQYIRLVMCLWPSTTTASALALTGLAWHGRLGPGPAELQHRDLDVPAALWPVPSHPVGHDNRPWLRPSAWKPGLAHRNETAKLGHVTWPEFAKVRYLKQLHGANDLAAQDLYSAVDAGPAASHQAVQIGPADEGELRAKGDRRDD